MAPGSPQRLPAFVLAWLLAFLVVPAIASAACSGATTNTFTVVSGDWATMGNWSKGVPIAGDHVCIPSGSTVTITTDPVEIADLELEGSLTVGNALTLDGGTGSSRLDGTIQLDSPMSVGAGAFLSIDNGTDVPGVGTLSNAGTLAIDPGPGQLTTINTALNNSGVVSNSGPVTLTGGGNWTGDWKLGSGSGPDAPLLNLGSGTYQLDGLISDVDSGGLGQLEIGSASVNTTVDATHIDVYDLNVSDAAAFVDISPIPGTATAIDVDYLTNISTNFEVDAPLRAGTFTSRDGNMICNGVWSATTFHWGGGQLSAGNPHGCTFAVGNLDMTVVAGDSGARQAVNSNVNVSGSGTQDTPYSSGTLDVAAGSTLKVGSGVRWVIAADVDITGAGSILVDGTLDKTIGSGGDTTIDPLLDVPDGTLSVSQGLMILTQLPAQYDSILDALNFGTWILAGTLRMPGPITTMNTGTQFIGSGPHLEDSTNANADALTTLTSNSSGNTISLSGNAQLTPPAGQDFNNGGTINLGGTASIIVDPAQKYVQNTAGAVTNLTTAGATLSATTVDISIGTLGGIGTVNGTVTNSGGTISPGNSPGTLSINGDFTQNGTGLLHEEIDGPAVGQYDRLVVTGTATLGGTLVIASTNGYQAPAGQSFPIVLSGALVGTWGGVVQSSIAPFFDQANTGKEAVLVANSVSIADATANEGNSGTTDFTFTIALAQAAPAAASVDWATQDGTAVAGSDYTAASGTVNFAPGETTKTVTVTVKGDTDVEPTENFAVNLSNPVGTRIADAQGVGTITNDDSPQAGAAQVQPGDIDGSVIAPPPIQGKAVNVEPVSGTVTVKLPGTTKFVPLPDAEQVPVGTIVDATSGKVRLYSVAKGGRVQFADFYEGVFRVDQKPGNPLTTLTLVGGSYAGCPKPKAARTSAKRRKSNSSVRHLWGDGKGSFKTAGRYASATIRGTRWLTDDRCNGTLIRVAVGAVTVRDLTLKKSLVLKKPKSYLAPAVKLKRG